MSNISNERYTSNANDGVKITRSFVSNLASPQQEAMLQLDKDLKQVETTAQSKGLLLNIYRQFTCEGGGVMPVSRDELLARLQSRYRVADIDATIEQLKKRGVITADELSMRISSGVLAKLIDKKVQTETASLQKVEAFLNNRFDHYIEKDRDRAYLLGEADYNSIGPYIPDLVLDADRLKFVRDSHRAINLYKRRRSILIIGTIAVLAALATAAVYFAIRAQQEAEFAKEGEESALKLREKADIEAINAQMAERLARDAEARLLIANDSLGKSQVKIQGLYQQVSREKDEAIIARRNEERQRLLAEDQSRIATTRALEIEKLSKDLQLYAHEQAREAEIAREAEEEAMLAKEESDELRNILLSHNVAQRSLALKEGDKDLKAYTASLAYYINEHAEQGDVRHPDIYRSLYYAAKNLGTGTIPEPLDIASGAIGNLSCEGNSCLTCSSDGKVLRFSFDPNTGELSGRQQLYSLPYDAVHYVFPTQTGSAFVMGVFPYILEITLGNSPPREIKKIPITDAQFIRSAVRIDDRQLMLQTTDNSVSILDADGQMQPVLEVEDGAIAWTALPHLGLVCFANTENELILTDNKRTVNVRYATAKKRVSAMLLKQHKDMIYLALGYSDGELEVFISYKDAFLSAYQSQLQGKNLYQIKSLRSSIHTGHIPALIFAETEPLLAVCSYDGSVSVWDLEQWVKRQGAYQPLILDDHDDWVMSCAFVPGEDALITGTKLGTAKYWNLDPAVYAQGMCSQVRREPNEEEWREYIGDELLSYRDKVCREKE